MGCVAGLGPDGSALVLALSRLWPGRYVVGFATIGYAEGGAMLRRGRGDCEEAGMRDTRSSHSIDAQQQRIHGDRWNDFEALPWADQRSPGAKVAIDGRLIRGAEL